MSETTRTPFVAVADVLASNVPAGGGQFIERHGQVISLTLRCACSCGALSAVVFGPGGWTFDGNRDKPTITPAMRSVGGCGWQGELTAGEFIALKA
jgi:hypothetical protein